MTTNDYDARLARLEAATTGDTVTIPDGWEWGRPGLIADAQGALRRADLQPGDMFTHDGTNDNLRWETSPGARSRPGNRYWYTSEQLAAFGLDVDAADEAEDEQVVVSDVVPDSEAIAGDFSDEAWGSDTPADEDDDNETSTVTVRVVPDTDGFVEAVEKAAREAADAADAAGFHLDEYQRERVAALEHARRILEARRDSGKTRSTLLDPATPSVVPAGDLVAVAAFIADGEVRA